MYRLMVFIQRSTTDGSQLAGGASAAAAAAPVRVVGQLAAVAVKAAVGGGQRDELGLPEID